MSKLLFCTRALLLVTATATATATCSLAGPLPQGWGRLTSLEELRLCHNALSGSIPDDIFVIPSLVFVDLSANCLENEVNGVMLHGSLLKTNCWTIRAQLTSPVHGCKNYPTLISSVFPKTCVLFERGSFIHQVFLSTVPGMLFKAKFVCDNTALS